MAQGQKFGPTLFLVQLIDQKQEAMRECNCKTKTIKTCTQERFPHN